MQDTNPSETREPVIHRFELDDLCGTGWNNVESDDNARWIWSRDRSEICPPNGVTEVELPYFSRYTQITGKPQNIRVFVDDVAVIEDRSTADLGVLRIPYEDGAIITLEADALRPSDFPGRNDTRMLGIALYQSRENEVERGESEAKTENVTRPPVMIQVEVTAACHLACVMCARSVDQVGESAHMSEVVWERFLEMARRAESVNILGAGEPWLNGRFLAMLRELDDAGVAITLSTSGDLVNEERARALGALRNLRLVTFSIDAPEADAYRRIRGQALDRALAGVRRTLRHLNDPSKVRIAATVMRDNMESLADFPALLRGLGVRRLNLRGVNNTMDNTRAMIPAYTETEKEILRNVRKEAEADGVVVNMLPTLPWDLIHIAGGDFCDEGIGVARREEIDDAGTRAKSDRPEPVRTETPVTRVCYDPWEKAFVTKDGHVYPCEAYHLQQPMGSLASETFEEIWNGETYSRFRRKLLCGGNVGCRNCERRGYGEHLFNLYAAQIEEVQSGENGAVDIIVRNTGARAWTKESSVTLATSHPHDRGGSARYDASWLTWNRVCSHVETSVEPGEIGTFRCKMRGTPGSEGAEFFQLVVEGKCWLPGAEVQI